MLKEQKSFGISIHYHNRKQLPASIEETYEATYWNNLDEMIRRMDIISINCPLTKRNKRTNVKKKITINDAGLLFNKYF